MCTYTWSPQNRKYILKNEWTRRVFSIFRRKLEISQKMHTFSAEQEKAAGLLKIEFETAKYGSSSYFPAKERFRRNRSMGRKWSLIT